MKATAVTGNLFRMLGANARLGRTFTDEETIAGKSRVVVLSDSL